MKSSPLASSNYTFIFYYVPIPFFGNNEEPSYGRLPVGKVRHPKGTLALALRKAQNANLSHKCFEEEHEKPPRVTPRNSQEAKKVLTRP